MASFDLRTLSYLEVSQANLSAYSCIDNMQYVIAVIFAKGLKLLLEIIMAKWLC